MERKHVFSILENREGKREVQWQLSSEHLAT
jgi:hypothetical protein